MCSQSISLVFNTYTMHIEVPDYDECPSDEQKVQLNTGMANMGLKNDLGGWADLYLKDEIKKAIRENGFQSPSQVQKSAIPIIMQGRDLLCQARSGMGKTAVFIIGVLNKLSLINQQYTPLSTLVICHTRELAHQVNRDFRRFSRHFKKPDLRVSCFFGGIEVDVHKKQLSNKNLLPHIVIGTPGRLLELVRCKFLPLNKIQYFIIDECDKILQDMDLLKILKQFYQKMPRQRQVLMFTATLSPESIKTSSQFLTNEQKIFIDTGKLSLPGLQQYYAVVKDEDKLPQLMRILDGVSFDQGVIFVNRIQRASKLTNMLVQKLFNPICINSSMTQGERIMSYDSFKANKYRVLVATDLFGRGVDVQRVNLVINYDLPLDRQTYLHRIGRAGRFNTRGVSISFVLPDNDPTQKEYTSKDSERFKEIEEGLTYSIIELPKNLQEVK